MSASDTQAFFPPENDHLAHEPGRSFNVIARLKLVWVSPSGEKAPLTFAIAAPYVTLDGFWRTPIEIHGFGDPTPQVLGIDAVQSLYFAIEKIRQTLASLTAQGNKFTDPKGNTFDTEQYFKTG